MTNTARALYQFFSSFGLPAYVEYVVPDEAVLPYITYQLVEPDWRDSATLYARIWYRSPTWTGIAAKVDQISEAIRGGVTIPTPTGVIMLNKGSPFAQEQPMEGDDALKVIYLNLTLHAFTT